MNEQEFDAAVADFRAEIDAETARVKEGFIAGTLRDIKLQQMIVFLADWRKEIQNRSDDDHEQSRGDDL